MKDGCDDSKRKSQIKRNNRRIKSPFPGIKTWTRIQKSTLNELHCFTRLPFYRHYHSSTPMTCPVGGLRMILRIKERSAT